MSKSYYILFLPVFEHRVSSSHIHGVPDKVLFAVNIRCRSFLYLTQDFIFTYTAFLNTKNWLFYLQNILEIGTGEGEGDLCYYSALGCLKFLHCP